MSTEDYLRVRTGGQDCLIGDRPIKTLRLNREAREVLLTDLRALPRSTSAIHREWESWLKGAAPLLKVAFDQAAASDAPDITLLSPIHPLVRQAAEHLTGGGRFITWGVVETAEAPPGDYPFAVYQWRFLGLQEDVRFRAVSAQDALSGRLEALLAKALPIEGETLPTATPGVLDALESRQYAEWQAARETHRAATNTRASFRLASLKSSHAARVAQLEDLLHGASDERIRRMYSSQMQSAHADYERRAKDIENAITSSDLQTERVASGVLRIRALPPY